MKKLLAILLVATCSLTAQAQFVQKQLKFVPIPNGQAIYFG